MRRGERVKWDSGLDIVDEWRGEDYQRDGPGAQHGAKTVSRETPRHDKGDDDAGGAGAGPHDTIREALARDEPFVQIQNGGGVEKRTADGVENALGDDEVPDSG